MTETGSTYLSIDLTASLMTSTLSPADQALLEKEALAREEEIKRKLSRPNVSNRESRSPHSLDKRMNYVVLIATDDCCRPV